MIDIIIPAYNAHSTIGNALGSIAKQINRDCLQVYIVNDGSERDYSNFIDDFSGILNIEEITIKNSGPGKARQVGIDSSKNEYIVFVDADDVLYNEYSLVNLLSIIGNADLAEGRFIETHQDGSSTELNPQYCYLHGKMYRRSIIEKNKLKFNSPKQKDGDLYEDSAFNQLYNVCCETTVSTEEIIYIYNFNENSLTKKEINRERNLKYFIDEMAWLAKEIDKRNLDNSFRIAWNIYIVCFHIYYNHLITKDESEFVFKDKNMILLKDMYSRYKDCLDWDNQLYLYKLFNNYDVIPYISFYDFMDKIGAKKS